MFSFLPKAVKCNISFYLSTRKELIPKINEEFVIHVIHVCSIVFTVCDTHVFSYFILLVA